MRHFHITLLIAALVMVAGRVSAETLRATDVIRKTDIDWMAFMRAQKAQNDGKSVTFIWPGHPAASYAEIRRALWLAALHGITQQTSNDPQTRRLMEPELRLMQLRLMEPFAYDAALRDNRLADQLGPLMIAAQVGCLLIGETEPSPLKFAFLCKPDGISVEGSEVVLTSPTIAASFAQSSHIDSDLVFETSGRIASDVFVRRFQDGTVTIVNLTNATRRDLTYRHEFTRLTFDLLPMDVVHLLQYEPPRLTHEINQRFITGLWQITFEGDHPSRVIDSKELSTAISENYRGTVRYQSTLCIPTGVKTLFLSIDSGDSETEVSINGKSLGIRAWEPFEWAIPGIYRGRDVTVGIRVEKRTIKGGLQALPSWRSH